MAQARGRRGIAGRSRREWWRAQVEAWAKSGWSQAEFCRRRGLSPVSLSWWKGELRRRGEEIGVEGATRRGRRGRRGGSAEAGGQSGRPGLLPVRIFAPTPGRPVAVGQEEFAFEVVLRGGVRVRVSRGFDLEELRRVVEALEGVRC